MLRCRVFLIVMQLSPQETTHKNIKKPNINIVLILQIQEELLISKMQKRNMIALICNYLVDSFDTHHTWFSAADCLVYMNSKFTCETASRKIDSNTWFLKLHNWCVWLSNYVFKKIKFWLLVHRKYLYIQQCILLWCLLLWNSVFVVN